MAPFTQRLTTSTVKGNAGDPLFIPVHTPPQSASPDDMYDTEDEFMDLTRHKAKSKSLKRPSDEPVVKTAKRSKVDSAAAMASHKPPQVIKPQNLSRGPSHSSSKLLSSSFGLYDSPPPAPLDDLATEADNDDPMKWVVSSPPPVRMLVTPVSMPPAPAPRKRILGYLDNHKTSTHPSQQAEHYWSSDATYGTAEAQGGRVVRSTPHGLQQNGQKDGSDLMIQYRSKHHQNSPAMRGRPERFTVPYDDVSLGNAISAKVQSAKQEYASSEFTRCWIELTPDAGGHQAFDNDEESSDDGATALLEADPDLHRSIFA